MFVGDLYSEISILTKPESNSYFQQTLLKNPISFLGLAYVRADDTLSSGHHHGNHTTSIFIGIIIIEAITKKFICATKVGF